MRNILTEPLQGGAQSFAEVFSALVMLAVFGAALTLTSCAVNKDTLSQSTGQASAIPQPPPAKPQISAVPTQSLQELTVREERGQSTLFVKFSQPVTEYRHFTLPQPARIVLDILNDTKTTALADAFRIDTGIVSTLRLNANENNLRLVLEIAAATTICCRIPSRKVLPVSACYQNIVKTQPCSLISNIIDSC